MNSINKLGIVWLGLLAAFAATICDAYHVYTQTLSYPKPVLFNQAWWVFPGFFTAFVGMALIYLLLAKILPKLIATHQSQSQGDAQAVVETMLFFVFVYLLSAFGNFDPKVLCVIFYSTFLIRLIFSYERVWLLIIAIALGVGGMFAEGLLSYMGLVAYRHVDIFYVPYWLGGLYMHGAFALRAGMRGLVYRS